MQKLGEILRLVGGMAAFAAISFALAGAPGFLAASASQMKPVSVVTARL
jgi:hypothetical protein